jgi:hypothetical protein
MIAGVRVRDLERLSPRVLAGVLPRLYPQMLARAYAHQDAGDARLHPDRRLPGDGRPARPRARLRRRSRLALGGRRRPLHRQAGRTPSTTARARCSRCASWPSARASIWTPPTPTRTPSPTCRCCAPCGHAVVVNPDPDLRRIARRRAGRCCDLDRLGRRLKMLAGGGGAAALGGVGRHVARGRVGARPGPRA